MEKGDDNERAYEQHLSAIISRQGAAFDDIENFI